MLLDLSLMYLVDLKKNKHLQLICTWCSSQLGKNKHLQLNTCYILRICYYFAIDIFYI